MAWKNIEARRAWERRWKKTYRKLPHVREKQRRYARNHYLAHSQDYKKRARDQYKNNKDKARNYQIEAYYRNKHDPIFKKKKYARNSLRHAVKVGKMVRPNNCARCGKPGKPEAHHHNGYEKEHWLDVTFLCRQCHQEAK